jgi:hypothetical protein
MDLVALELAPIVTLFAAKTSSIGEDALDLETPAHSTKESFLLCPFRATDFRVAAVNSQMILLISLPLSKQRLCTSPEKEEE